MAVHSDSWATGVRWSAHALQPVIDAYAPARRVERVRRWLSEEAVPYTSQPAGTITLEMVDAMLQKVYEQGMRLPTEQALRAEKAYWDRFWARYLPVFDDGEEVPTDV